MPLAQHGVWGGATPGITPGATPPPSATGVAPVRTYPCEKAQPPALARDLRAPTRCTLLDRLIRVFIVIGGVTGLCAVTWPGSFPAGDPVAILVQNYTPNVYTAVVAWYYVAPGVAVFLAGQLLISTGRIWFARMGFGVGLRARLPRWPLSPMADGPAIVIGEVHHPVKLVESATPDWLMIPERGLYTGVVRRARAVAARRVWTSDQAHFFRSSMSRLFLVRPRESSLDR